MNVRADFNRGHDAQNFFAQIDAPKFAQIQINDDSRLKINCLVDFRRQNLRNEKFVEAGAIEAGFVDFGEEVEHRRNFFRAKFFDVIKFHELIVSAGQVRKFFAVVVGERVVVENVNRDGRQRLGNIFKGREHGSPREFCKRAGLVAESKTNVNHKSHSF